MKTKKAITGLLGVVFFALLAGCNPGYKNMDEYRNWFNDEGNGFTKVKYVNHLRIKAQYRPVDFMMLNELKNMHNAKQVQVDSLRKTYGNSLYFMLEIGYDERGKDADGDIVLDHSLDYKEYASKVSNLSFGMKGNVMLICGADTISPSLYNYERGYELGKKEAFLFAFPNPNAGNKKVIFSFNDEFFNTGINNFQFSIGGNNMPKLALK